jgi:acetate kinase
VVGIAQAMEIGPNSQKRTILALNSGSSSLKLGLYSLQGTNEEILATGAAEALGTKDGRVWMQQGEKFLLKENRAFATSREAADFLTKTLTVHSLPEPEIIGHRIVHGGPRLREHVRITPEVLKDLEAATVFAPIHTPPALEVIRFAMERFPRLPNVACLDTAFHRTLPEHAARLPLPDRFWQSGIRRYGFHGLSCESIVHTLGANLASKTVIAHLGNGASVTAVKEGCSIETTMGLTPTGGVIMGTRSGDLDPGVLLHLLRDEAYDAQQLEQLLNYEAGLLGISGTTNEMRSLLESSATNTSARLAVEMFCYSVRKAVGAMAAVLGGLELLVFSGGIGEHAAPVRAGICTGLDYLGIALDPEANARHADVISTSGSRCSVRVVPTDEDLQIARHCSQLA